MSYIVYLVSGLLFGAGLVISEMANPQKVVSFLNVLSVDWDPSLLFVLLAATPIYALAYGWISRKSRSWSGASFSAGPQKPIDRKLILGSILFGTGWGLLGFCPGPALAQISSFDMSVLIFVVAMFLGMETNKRWQ